MSVQASTCVKRKHSGVATNTKKLDTGDHALKMPVIYDEVPYLDEELPSIFLPNDVSFSDGEHEKKLKNMAKVRNVTSKSEFVAVRKSPSIGRCIFMNWKDAEPFLDDSPSSEYTLCESIENAVKYAFVLPKDKAKKTKGQETIASRAAPVSIPVSPKQDLSFSTMAQLRHVADDVVKEVLSYACGSELQFAGSDNKIVCSDVILLQQSILSGFASASKLCKKQCEAFVQRTSIMFGPEDLTIETVSKLCSNKVKIGKVKFIPLNNFDFCLFIHMLETCDIENLQSWRIDLMDYMMDDDGFEEAPGPLEFAEWKLECIAKGIPYDAVEKVEDMDLSYFTKYLASKQFHSSELILDTPNLHFDILGAFQDSVIDLSYTFEGSDFPEEEEEFNPPEDLDNDQLHAEFDRFQEQQQELGFGQPQAYNYSKLTDAIEKMSKLKKLSITANRIGPIHFKSESLESLVCPKSNFTNIFCDDCPSLKEVDLVMSTLDWSVLASCSQTLESARYTVSDPTVDDFGPLGATEIPIASVKRKLAELGPIIKKMPNMKKFGIVSDSTHYFSDYFFIDVVSDSLQVLDCEIALRICRCPALRELVDRTRLLQLENMPNVGEIPFEVDFAAMERLDLCYNGDAEGIEPGLLSLEKTIQKMPNLKWFGLHNLSQMCKNQFKVKSSSLEYINIGDGLEVTEFDCPKAKTIIMSDLPSTLELPLQIEELRIEKDYYDMYGTLPEHFEKSLESMPNLRRLSLTAKSGRTKNAMCIRSKSLESLDVYCYNPGITVKCHDCPNLKYLHFSMHIGDRPPCFSQSIRNLSLTLWPYDLNSKTARHLAELGQRIELLQNLKHLTINKTDEVEGEMTSQSHSLEEMISKVRSAHYD